MSSQPVQSASRLALGSDAAVAQSAAQRYVQLALLVLAAGAIYPILYLRQVYQPTMLEVFHITDSQLGYLYSSLGTDFPAQLSAERLARRPHRAARPDLLLADRNRRARPAVFDRAAVCRAAADLRRLGPDDRPHVLGRRHQARDDDRRRARTRPLLRLPRRRTRPDRSDARDRRDQRCSRGPRRRTASRRRRAFSCVVYMYAFLCIGSASLLGLVKDRAVG